MARKGWVKEQRKELDSLVYTNAFYFKLWRTLLMLANHSDGKVTFNGREIPVSSGQLVTGRDALASVYNRGAKPDQQKEPRSLWRWVKKFESWQMLSINSTSGYSVISITNWGKYQERDQQLSSNGPANVQLMSTNKNVKNVKNEEKNTSSESGLSPTDEFTVEIWPKYPRKEGNYVNAQRAYTQAIETGDTTKEQVLAKIAEYKKYIEINGIGSGFVTTGGNWFTGQGWHNEYDTSKPAKPSRPAGSTPYSSTNWDGAKMEDPFAKGG